MDKIIIIFAGIAITAAAFIITRQIIYQRKATAELIKKKELYEKRQKKAQLGKGLIIHSDGGVMPAGTSSKAPVSLTMEITPGSNGKPYRAKTQWLVDVTALSYVAQGQEVAVKIDTDDKSKIYPNSAWAKYIVS